MAEKHGKPAKKITNFALEPDEETFSVTLDEVALLHEIKVEAGLKYTFRKG